MVTKGSVKNLLSEHPNELMVNETRQTVKTNERYNEKRSQNVDLVLQNLQTLHTVSAAV